MREQGITELVRQSMESFGLEGSGTRILAGVSGGADSVCMLLVLKELGYEVSAVHVEHGIRGEESIEDCAYVRSLCDAYRVPLHVVQVDAPAAARECSMTLEEAARCERRRVFRETAGREGIRIVATAHHRMDQAETVLWNLIRGSSVGGLGGIRPARREDGLLFIRPLLECGKEQIEGWLRQKGISWRTDRTNYDTRITRNAIRLKVMPLLEELNPLAAEHITQAASDFRQVEEWLVQEENDLWARVILEEGDKESKDLTADRVLLGAAPGILRGRILRRMIGRCTGSMKDIGRTHVDALDRLVSGPNGRMASLPGGFTAFSEEGILRLTRQKEEPGAGDCPIGKGGVYSFPRVPDGRQGEMTAEVSYLTWQGGEVPKKKYTKYLAYDTMAPCLVLRTRRPGDYLMVNAAHGRRKLKDYLIDEKVPRLMRDSIPLIAQGSHVLWVIGKRISEGAKVREGTECVRITVSGFQ